MGFSPSVVSFGDVAATTTQTIDVVFTGASAESRSASVSGAGFSVATKETAADSHTVTVTFSPTGVESYGGTLSFAPLAPEGAPDTCSVSGAGTNPVSFSAASVAFGTLTLGDSTQRIAMVSNAGATAATVSF